MSSGRIMVDEIIVWPTRIACFKGGSCHLTTDGPLEDLHAFAARIGLKRAWFQEHPSCPHYDLTPRRREAALAAGAVFVPGREQARVRRENRLARVQTATQESRRQEPTHPSGGYAHMGCRCRGCR